MSATSPTTPGGGKPKSKTYEGSCHCGQVTFSVKASPPVEDSLVTSCNCSICHINGYLMIYPLETNVTWQSGYDALTPYKFGHGSVAHTFCPKCGTAISAKSTNESFANNRAINVRTLKFMGEPIDLDAIKLRKVDGRSR